MPETALVKNTSCPKTPRAGAFAGKPCLRPEGQNHPGACVYDPAKLEATIQREESQRPIPMTDEEITNAFTADEIRQRAQALDDAQSVWEQVRDQAMPKLLCPQCSGRGTIHAGSLGEHCDRCNGTRVVQDLTKPFDFAMPDFAALRAPISAYGDAHALRAHGVRAALPAKSTVPDLATIHALTSAAQKRALELGPAQMPELPKALPPKREDGGIEDTATDAELVEYEHGEHGGEGG
jgi:hypothetical protein